jgi:hypothetical protein
MRTIIAAAVLFVLFAVLLALVPAFAQSGRHGEGHAQHHDEYQHWKRPGTNASCCSNADCRPTRTYRDDNDQWRAWDGRRWIVVPDSKVLNFRAKDGAGHLCEANGVIYCLVPGEPKS